MGNIGLCALVIVISKQTIGTSFISFCTLPSQANSPTIIIKGFINITAANSFSTCITFQVHSIQTEITERSTGTNKPNSVINIAVFLTHIFEIIITSSSIYSTKVSCDFTTGIIPTSFHIITIRKSFETRNYCNVISCFTSS